jgi:putative acetyltransferase
MALKIRAETPADREAVFAVHAAAFATRSEADLVDALRERAQPTVSLVAESGGRIVGHILFSPAFLDRRPGVRIMALGPMSVLPDCQRAGIGAALVRAGLEACRQQGAQAVVVLGHPPFYPRFGFAPASKYGIHCEYDVPDEVFMALELEANALGGPGGTLRYHETFEELG